ncbi:exodeoxyribonuclease 7 large subunit [mine drainage metagenome]|uniref:Exodeoxyribonuclease 7 large subunit n=1 Tax=mine drainage metagenome TaxID=410659 RepID=A0A1J5RC72_9ZZZZ
MAAEVLTVSGLNRHVREILQQNFPLLWVGGEVSNLTRASSGHVYFSLKDEAAQVRCVMFKNRAHALPWRLENGQQVEAQALVTLFEARGDFQLNIEGLRRAGLGARYETYARLREKLEREGLFATERKRALPRFPRRIGIVTSPQAAALHDVLTTLRRRAPHLPAILYPTPVQGEGAAEKVATAIVQAGQRVVTDAIDVLIVVRGGGSIEDLWAFNEEVVARAVAGCPIAVVSGIGHETDTTIADFAADRRAATPTAAAELVSAGWFAARHEIAVLADDLRRGLRDLVEVRMQRIDLLAHRLIHPGTRLARDRQLLAHLATRLSAALAKRQRSNAIALDQLRLRLARIEPQTQSLRGCLALAEQRLSAAWRNRLAAQRGRLGALAAALAQLSPQATLARGYSVVRDRHGAVLRDSSQVAAGDAVELHFAVGWARAKISETG